MIAIARRDDFRGGLEADSQDQDRARKKEVGGRKKQVACKAYLSLASCYRSQRLRLTLDNERQGPYHGAFGAQCFATSEGQGPSTPGVWRFQVLVA